MRDRRDYNDYLDYCMANDGVFIEKHPFIQIMTPCCPLNDGYILVGRECKDSSYIKLIGIFIPFGCSLIVEPWAIHGDSAFIGKYQMAMTCEHREMRKADTVFLRNRDMQLIGLPAFSRQK